MSVLAFAVGLWLGVELLAQTMGIIDVASTPRHLPPVLLRLVAVVGASIWLATWLGIALIAGVLVLLALHVLKLSLWGRYVDWLARSNRPWWSEDETSEARDPPRK